MRIDYLCAMRNFAAAVLPLVFALCFAHHALSPASSSENRASSSENDIPQGDDVPEMRCLLGPLEVDSLSCAAAILVEARTATVLYEQDADVVRTPASLVKMMLEVLILEAVGRKEASLQDSVLVSKHAVSAGGARFGLVAGERVPLGELLEAIAVVSANDAAIAAAEHLAGSEESFVARMNDRALALGCEKTKFTNCHGLDPPGRPGNVSTARDLSRIAVRLIELPGALDIASMRETTSREKALLTKTTNELLGAMKGVDGLKTGFTARAGGCFCGTIERDDVRFVSVVLGAAPGPLRFEITRHLFESAYASSPRWVDRVLLASSTETK